MRVLFWLYAVVLFGATHYPLPFQLPGRTDLLAHLAAFSVWTLLLVGAANFGPPLSPRNLNRSAMTAAAYSLLDEGLQGIPALHRVMCWEDAAMNLAAVLLTWALLRVGNSSRG
ncbi:MAG: hypothetical protein AB1758_09245 [Candidatus Eremiobacterota bacterium]